MSSKPYVVEKTFNASPERVWKAITDKEEMKQWYFNLEEFIPEPGFEFRFYGKGRKGEEYLHICKITEVIPGKKLTYSWRYDNYEGISFVSFELFPEGEKTKLKLTHEGIETFRSDNPDFAIESFASGWTELIKCMLPAYLQKNIPQKTTTFIMFAGQQSGKAEEAIRFYTSLLKNSEIKNIIYFKAGEPGGNEGEVKQALFTLAGQTYRAMDGGLNHQFSFTPSISIFVECESEEEMDTIFARLSDRGTILMPAGYYGFSKKFGWTNDRFGVSWQVNLA